MMGAGKSAVGRPLADALGYRFVDADTAIEAVAGRPIPQLFAEQGEAGFRDLETAVIGQIATWHSLVVATGGGVVTRPENWGHMRQGVVIWLDAPAELLLARLGADPTPRPLLQGDDREARLQALLQERRPLYHQADLQICQSDESPATVAALVLEALPGILKSRGAPPEGGVVLQDSDGQLLQSFN
ncbi:MAG: shikimate kinase [Cyanobacteria bacterium REEB417]|nr:shikimate kinase [Cyanobacteria bacterium REEB417]